MIERLEVPASLQRNAPEVAAIGYERTGMVLITLATERLGLASLEDVDVLDVGCGVRFAMTIINRGLRIKSYTGIDVDRSVVQFLQENVAAHDPRFRFEHFNVGNQLFNPSGPRLDSVRSLPVEGDFDVIWLFSVFTHLNPADAKAMLRLLRGSVRPGGKLFFSAFIDHELDGFEDRATESPLLLACYGKPLMERLIQDQGWSIDRDYEKDELSFIQHSFLCSPAPDAQRIAVLSPARQGAEPGRGR